MSHPVSLQPASKAKLIEPKSKDPTEEEPGFAEKKFFLKPEKNANKNPATVSLIKGLYLPNLKTLASSKDKCKELGIDNKTRKLIMDAEYYHYLTIQIRWNTIVTFLISIFEIFLFIICLLSMDE